MSDLSALIGKAQRGNAAESASVYFGDILRDMLRRATAEMEAATMDANDARLRYASMKVKVVNEILRRFEQDIKSGMAAQKEL